MPLTDRQRVFVTAYLRSGEPERAALDAGYTPYGARRTAYRLLRSPDVVAEIHRVRLTTPAEELTALQYLLRVMNDPAAPLRRRLQAAIAAAPHVHAKAGK